MTLAQLRLFGTAVFLLLFLHQSPSAAQEEDKLCKDKFSVGKEDFVLNTDESVKEGATFLGSPQVSKPEDCVLACCNDPNCNLALMEHREDPKSINTCFIINCLYKQKKVCHFVRKKGFTNYLRKSVFSDYLEQKATDVEDRPPRARAGQDRVVQPNEDVTLNGIESSDDKKIVKYEWEQVVGDPSAVMTKGHFADSVTVSNLSPGMYKFRLTVSDEAGQTGSAEVSILVLTQEQSLHHCLVPKKEGPCRGSFLRWHYNAVTEKCEEFKFGGCKPNRNNYLALNECQSACNKVSVSNPHPSGRIGSIDAVEQCDRPCSPEHFTCDNKCCIGKDLECDKEKQCSDGSDEKECDKLKTIFNDLRRIPLDVSKARCVQPPVTGTCRASFTKWYYNPYELRCNRFNYGGCDGNQNNFKTKDECMTFCSGVTETDTFPVEGQFEKSVGKSNDTVAIVMVIILAFAIAILLVIIAYCLVKGRKKSRNKHQQVAVNGGHIYRYEDSEKLVYNSTTKPI
nr:Spint1a protein [Danio rerio]